MNFSARLGAIRQSAGRLRQLLDNEQMVVCFGSRAQLCFFLAGHLEEHQLAGAFTTAAETLHCIASQQPGYLLCSDQLEAGCGLELVIAVKQRWPAMRTLLMIGGRPRPALLRAVVDAGCDGLLLEHTMGQGTATSLLETVCRGGIVVDRALLTLLRDHPTGPSAHAHLQSLSSRELEVLTLLCRGSNNAEIAAQLVIALDTVKSHIKNLLLKLGAKGRTHAAVMALELGLVPWPQQVEHR
jgi:DNA-binding NarL/FixJ family response regulator